MVMPSELNAIAIGTLTICMVQRGTQLQLNRGRFLGRILGRKRGIFFPLMLIVGSSCRLVYPLISRSCSSYAASHQFGSWPPKPRVVCSIPASRTIYQAICAIVSTNLTKMVRHSHWPPLTHVSCACLATISSRSTIGECHLRCFG